MSAPIGPGDWVECVDASLPTGVPALLVLGGIYRVEECHDLTQAWRGLRPAGPGVRLFGIDFVPQGQLARVTFALDRFRPIYRPKSEIIEALKQPAPEIVRERIDA